MNVLLLTDKLIVGGAETYFCKLENHLAHRNLTFYYGAATGELQSRLLHQDKYVELTRHSHGRNFMTLYRFIKKHSIKVIHANSLRMLGYGILLKHFCEWDIQLIYTKHNVTILEKKMPLLFSKLLNTYVKRIITVSQFERDSLVLLGVNPQRIQTIHNGVDLQQFPFKKAGQTSPIHVGILARLSEEKNHELFIEVAEKMKNERQFRFFIGGDGPEKDYLQQLITRKRLEDQVVMCGEIEHPETFIKEMDVMLVTSKREVFPMVVIESMAVGTPVVSIDCGGIKEAVTDGVTGYLIPQHSADLFKDKITSLFSSTALYSHIVKSSRERVEERFSLDQMVEKTVREYLFITEGTKKFSSVVLNKE
ncbi:glycosyltransferase family 4 protein [Halobacillus kuroshimensis]|uniref:Glycosyltransferase family 4 protein n=1 Tax=Halobacillus kuroshimensis TaxID=302481 RepID=A0ABS3DV37_9BACI|nr:glycosyltransferase family 4 protein [Halobacillus kuroshimensis]MBN8235213.1 glycosyltransferase family 4 protein [Halobacillus kuroshimensis]